MPIACVSATKHMLARAMSHSAVSIVMTMLTLYETADPNYTCMPFVLAMLFTSPFAWWLTFFQTRAEYNIAIVRQAMMTRCVSRHCVFDPASTAFNFALGRRTTKLSRQGNLGIACGP